MSKLLQEQVDKLFEATKDLQSLEEIKPYCDDFKEWIKKNTSYTIKSLGTVLSKAGFYKKFKSLPLEQGKNAKSVPKRDAEGNVTGNQLKHYVLVLCGLNEKQWEERNETTRVSDRLTTANEDGNKGIEIDPDRYLEITEKLLSSDNPNELAVGLIASTGRRPHEILARGKFTTVDGESYQVEFEGQGKKRGDEPVFKISTLFGASHIIGRLNHLRNDITIKELLKSVKSEFPDDVAAQNKAVEDRRGNSLRRIVQKYFGGKDSNEPLLNFRHGQEQNDCTALRAACACLVTERDCPGSVGAKMYFAACFLGHVIPGEKLSDSKLKSITTTLGYSDYYTTKPVRFPGDQPKEKRCNVRVSPSDLEAIRYLQEQLKVPNHPLVISELIHSYNNRLDAATQLETAEQEIAELSAQVKQLQEINNKLQESHDQLEEENKMINATKLVKADNSIVEDSQSVVNLDNLHGMIQKMVDEAVEKALQDKITTPVTAAKLVPPKEEIDWETKTNAEVWGSKAPLAALEKIRRSYRAIALYNDTVATGDSDRLAITNQALRELSGCNGLLVRDWIEQHKDEIISHNAKFGMENKKDPSNPASYANKGKDTDKILLLINEEFLGGEGFKAGRN
ncbi:MAG: protelomerase family protein [Nostoc sp.]